MPLAMALVIVLHAPVRSSEHGDGRNCTDPAACPSCVPACQATWDQVKTRKPAYSIGCEHACARDYDCWCAEGPECRCSPPCGRVIVKKRLYKAEGDEKVEKVPKYDVKIKAAEPCDCARCQGVCFWNPLAVLHYLLHY
jgi:hypothetical protein